MKSVNETKISEMQCAEICRSNYPRGEAERNKTGYNYPPLGAQIPLDTPLLPAGFFIARCVLCMAIICLMISPILSFAQTGQIKGVQLNNGEVIYGKILQMSTDTIKMETAAGKTIFLKFDNIKNFIRETSPESQVKQTPKLTEPLSPLRPQAGAKYPGQDLPSQSRLQNEAAKVNKTEDSSGQAKRSTFSLGLMYYYYDYKEDLVLPSKSTESGWLTGIAGSYTYRRDSVFYHKIYVHYAAGNLTYDGATLAGTPITFDDNPHKFIKLQWDFGFPWAVNQDLIITPHLGIGWRYWERGAAKITATYTSYKEIYTWGYFPLGINIDYDINKYVHIGGSLAANVMFGGNMKAFLSEVSVLPDMEFSLGNRIGWSAELPVTFKFSGSWSLTATPWYEYSAIGESDPNIFGFYEPASKTNQYGVNLSVNYSF